MEKEAAKGIMVNGYLFGAVTNTAGEGIIWKTALYFSGLTQRFWNIL
jgi:hypothetical protein